MMKHYCLPFGYSKAVNNDCLYRVNDKVKSLPGDELPENELKEILDSDFTVNDNVISISKDSIDIVYGLSNTKKDLLYSYIFGLTKDMLYSEFDIPTLVNIEFDAYEIGTEVYYFDTESTTVEKGIVTKITIVSSECYWDENAVTTDIQYVIEPVKSTNKRTMYYNLNKSKYLTDDFSKITDIVIEEYKHLKQKYNDLYEELEREYEKDRF